MNFANNINLDLKVYQKFNDNSLVQHETEGHLLCHLVKK